MKPEVKPMHQTDILNNVVLFDIRTGKKLNDEKAKQLNTVINTKRLAA